MEFKTIIVSALLIGLFVVALVSFMNQIHVDNDTNTSLLDNPSINRAFGNISQQLNESQSRAESQRKAFAKESSNPILTTIGFIFSSIVNAGNLFLDMSVGMFNAVFGVASEILGIPAIVIGILFSILLITSVFLLWRAVKAGG